MGPLWYQKNAGFELLITFKNRNIFFIKDYSKKNKK